MNVNVTDLMVYEVEENGYDTSVEAYNAIRSKESKIHDTIMDAFENRDDDSGMTSLECAELLDMYPQTASTAFSKLLRLNRLEATAYVRKNSSGVEARVHGIAGLAFAPRTGDRYAPEKPKMEKDKAAVALSQVNTAIVEMKKKRKQKSLRAFKAELQRIAETIEC